MAGTDTLAQQRTLLSRAPSTGLVVCGIMSVQFGSAIAATIFHSVGPGGVVFLRIAFGSVLLSLIWRPRIRSRTRHELMLAGLFGLVLMAMNMCFYHAIERIPLGVAVTIEFVGPLTVAVIGSRRRADFVWIVLAALGILALMHGDTHSLNMLGVILALVAGGFWGVYILVNARVGKLFETGTGLSLAMCVAAVLAMPIGLVEGGSELLSLHVLLIGGVVGMLSSAIPYSFELEALRRIPTHVFGVLMSIEPAMAALAGFIVLGQALSSRELGGMALVVAASIGSSRRSREPIVDL